MNSFKNTQDNLINELDPEKFKCSQCEQWKDISDYSARGICKECNPYEPLVIPLLRTFFPRTIVEDLVSVQPMPKPEIAHVYNKYKKK